MSPYNQIGMSVEGRLFGGAFNYAVGVYNGLQRTDQFFQGYINNAAILGNRFDGLTYAARLTSEPLGSPGATMQDVNHDKLRLAAGGSVFFSNGGRGTSLGPAVTSSPLPRPPRPRRVPLQPI